MRNPLSKKITGIAPSGIRKFFDVANEMEGVISLGVGEPDFDTPWRIREEGIFSLERGRTFYTSNAGLMELRTEICRYLERKIHVSYSPKTETMVTVGGSEAIDVALRCMLEPGEEVLIPQPSYVSYLPCTDLFSHAWQPTVTASGRFGKKTEGQWQPFCHCPSVFVLSF